MPEISFTPKIVAWGQYVHWAHLQFVRFTSMSDEVSDGHQEGVVAHWLAAEHVVLEGWRQLGFTDTRISRLIQLYPENCEALRLCRNAVYHFQPEILDKRIFKCLKNENEELAWAAAMHGEFQNFLVSYPYLLSGTLEDQKGVSDEMRQCIGWMPDDCPCAGILRVLQLCRRLEHLLGVGEHGSPNGDEGRMLIKTSLERIVAVDEPSGTKLARWPV
jgi:hypothetical protein